MGTAARYHDMCNPLFIHISNIPVSVVGSHTVGPCGSFFKFALIAGEIILYWFK